MTRKHCATGEDVSKPCQWRNVVVLMARVAAGGEGGEEGSRQAPSEGGGAAGRSTHAEVLPCSCCSLAGRGDPDGGSRSWGEGSTRGSGQAQMLSTLEGSLRRLSCDSLVCGGQSWRLTVAACGPRW